MDALPGSDDSLIVQKLIMAWDDEVEVVNTLEEVERWLQNQEVCMMCSSLATIRLSLWLYFLRVLL